MSKKILNENDIKILLSNDKYKLWTDVCNEIESLYCFEKICTTGGKQWDAELKYRIASKTLCTLLIGEGKCWIVIIFGAAERERFELIRANLSDEICKTYDSTKDYHDGRWVLFEINREFIDDYMSMLNLKRKPNRKP